MKFIKFERPGREENDGAKGFIWVRADSVYGVCEFGFANYPDKQTPACRLRIASADVVEVKGTAEEVLGKLGNAT